MRLSFCQAFGLLASLLIFLVLLSARLNCLTVCLKGLGNPQLDRTGPHWQDSGMSTLKQQDNAPSVTITRAELYEKVWSAPMVAIAKEFGIGAYNRVGII
jgi:hypothetical protein